ncbi:Xaa-Pro dipeptidase [Polymorphobacter glacialis]|uniref:Xaa-Pro dipeptidase n=1 Tax=Sandarakinorhabdus glacialis TaxID=1614636 RepID=A0A916ZUD2_9SPHN|nr:amidohydrolase family protein [Polymorphobacter glacialis]GGE13687.1 Xaa-Pro dipeptidase [Polymorphobacter glacialis]
MIGIARAVVAALALAAGPAAAENTAIIGAAVYASPDAAVIRDAVVLVVDGRVTRVGTRASTPVPKGYRVIDQAGRYLVAGFWNNHVHLTTPVLLNAVTTTDAALGAELEKNFTRWGFTTIFDLASTTAVSANVRGRVSTGKIAGPRVLSVGEPFYPTGATPIYAREFYSVFKLPSAEIVLVADAERRVRAQVAAGAAGIKLFTGSIVGGPQGVVHMPAATIRALADAAHRLGKPVFAHGTDREGTDLAVANGVDILAHSAPLMEDWTAEYAASIAARKVAMVPTLSLFDASPDARTPTSAAVQQTAALHKAGGTILFGTDAGFTELFDTAPELRLMGKALDWRGVLAAMTTAPAATFGEADRRGRVARGYVADLVVVGGDPAVGVENLADVQLVMRGGRVIFVRP